jgi:hypothetical protein
MGDHMAERESMLEKLQANINVIKSLQNATQNGDAAAQAEFTALKAEIATLKAADTKLRKQHLALTMLFRRDILFSPAEFKTILRCLHPDNSASPEIRAQAFDLVRQKEKQLMGQSGRKKKR